MCCCEYLREYIFDVSIGGVYGENTTTATQRTQKI